ncbi:MAG TPA: flagellar motor switch protein FliN [Solirubrobacteraceae bacterium]
MSDAIDFAPLQPTVPAASEPGELGRLTDVTVEVSVEIGRTAMTLGEALALGPGSVVGLHRMAGEPVDLLVNGRVIARGEVVVIDEEFGLRVTDVAAPRGTAREEAEAPAAEAA